MNRRWDILILFIYLLSFTASCSNDQWFPEGKVEILEYSEFSNGSTTIINVPISIQNTGSSIISKSTIVLRIETDQRVYYESISQDVRILPKNIIVLTIVCQYYNMAESIITNGISIYDCYFE